MVIFLVKKTVIFFGYKKNIFLAKQWLYYWFKNGYIIGSKMVKFMVKK